MLRAVLLALVLTPAAAFAAEEITCRPNALGAISCPGDTPRPKPRPIYRAPVQALDRVEAKAAARRQPDRFVPARETRRLGGNVTLERGMSGPCRPDMLGNLNCR
ncbi:MAG TPA: hypothetical protein VM422_05615 [Amaricoccus sp.]|jgi:hypothetical protein|nr:hypothetical protein [Amaricoccus sp.]